MRFSVRHQTLYRYSAPVRLAEHVLRFNPRPEAGRLLKCGGDALAFLDRLNETLFVRIRHDIRAEGAARPAAATLALGHGACRDVTDLFLAACRSVGAPARFVSGYQAKADTPDGRRHLHAWPQAFARGLGWLGYDPTHGVKVTDGHVGLCAAPSQAATMPVEGGFYGGQVTSALDYQVEIETDAG